ncbi:hydantoinase/carbamoylase family amidase [Thioclava sp. SK-1]|uniref:hydantoinase/carbamoylase family amidase n=1 Tax=Thioclava sp. SK-1 TaxID=1889770 RepID=UPI0009F46887|nr:hydantoinase/carbamoylase family amidase [Thioclava sp. SK-1]
MSTTLDILRDTITSFLTEVNALSLPGPGWTRPSYSDLESAAHSIVERRALAMGLQVSRDNAGNLFAKMAGRNPKAVPIYIGSHLDTVAQGGAYDGQAGVAAALALVAGLRAQGITPQSDVIITVTRAEESVWFPVSYVGSRSFLGQVTRDEMAAKRSDTGRSLADHMREAGFDPEGVLQSPPPAPARFIECHIEQGPVLHEADESYAIVRGIRGGLRYRAATIHGVWAHSGGAPRPSRADAVMAFADLAMAMDQHWAGILAQGDDLAVTFGRVDAATAVHAMAKVPGQLEFCLDMRSDTVAVLERANGALMQEIARIEAARPGIRFDLGAQSRSQPATLSTAMQDFVAKGADLLGHAPRRMVSGGGHDAAAFAANGWESVLVFIRNWDGSHCPQEGMNPEDLVQATLAILAAVGHEAGEAAHE